MNEHALPTVWGLPAAAFLTPLGAAILVLLGKRLGQRFWQAVTLLGAAVTTVIGFAMLPAVLHGGVITAWGNELRVDALSALMVVLVGGIGLLAALYSVRYLTRAKVLDRVGLDVALRRLWVFHWLFLGFLGTMVWACVTNNVIMLFVAVEATTLTSGLLVAFFWDRRALEAGYKYLILLTIGVTFALFGCVLLYAAGAATGQIDGRSALLISELRKVAQLLPRGPAAMAVAFLVIGFGTKAGVVPFHAWLPDAHAEAPTPISVLLSGVMIKVAVYAMARTVSIFFPVWHALNIFLVALGIFTMFVGILLALRQDDLKRLLAFHSVSQMGYILSGIGLGTYLGVYGGLFHLLNHTIFKSLLFLSVGSLIFASGGLRHISQMSGLARRMPITATCFFVGALAMGGMPPFNGFMSKLTLFLAFVDRGLYWAAAIGMLTSLLTLACLVHAGYLVFWGKLQLSGSTGTVEPREAPPSMLAGMVVLAGLALLIGVFPQTVYPILDSATKCILQVLTVM